MNNKQQMSESLSNALFLTLSGGFQDAYTYICRGKVFANAQTGNFVFMSINMFYGDFAAALRYVISVLMFIGGIFTAELVHRHFKYLKPLHWRQLVLAGEIILLFVVGFFPHGADNLASALVSFVCAMQVQTFRKLNGQIFASTMCIGNMRTATESLCAYVHEKNIESLKKCVRYFGIIIIFAFGAGAGGVFTRSFGIRSIWVCCALLAISFCLMSLRPNEATDISV